MLPKIRRLVKMIGLNLPTDRKIMKAIISLQVAQPFFGYLAMNLKLHEANTTVTTMGVDHDFNLYYNTKWVEEEIPDFETLIGCTCHETLHPALNHIGRLGTRMPNISNIAQDMVVNMIVEKSGMKTVHGVKYVNVDPILDKAWVTIPINKVGKVTISNVSNKPWEVIYDELIKQIDKNGGEGSAEQFEQDMAAGGTKFVLDEHFHKELEKLSKEQQGEVLEKMKQVLTDALINGKMAGKVPGGMERFVTELLDPKIPWQSILQRQVKPYFDPNDWTYRKPHRKSYHHEIYMPSIKGEQVIMHSLIDTSGSIDQPSYNEFATEIYGMMRAFPRSLIYVSYCDTHIRNEYQLNGTDLNKLLTMKPTGGGGTDLEVGLDEIMKKNKDVKIVIVLTDGETPCRKKFGHYPFEIIWVISKSGMDKEDAEKHFTYGKVIKMG